MRYIIKIPRKHIIYERVKFMKKLSKCTRKILSVLLTTLMVLAIFTVAPISASAATYNFLFPVQNGKLAYYYGYSASYFGGTEFHYGIDIHSQGNDTIYAASDGVVEAIANSCNCGLGTTQQCPHYNTYGNYIRIGNTDGTKAYYGHLLKGSLLVSVGESVKRGQAIATMGSSGYSSGKHLHFEVRLSNKSTKINVNPTDKGGSVVYSYDGYDGGHNPIGAFDYVEDRGGAIYVRGWAFDQDDTSVPLSIHVYIGGPSGSGAPGYAITADTLRDDVHNVHGCGNRHGFDSVIQTDRTGSQTIYVYALNIGGGTKNPLLGTKTVNITSEKESPVISNIYWDDFTDTGFTLHFTITDNKALDYVRVYTWTSDTPQKIEDLDVAGNGWVISYRVNYSEFQNQKKGYIQVIHCFDTAGNRGDSSYLYIPYEDNAPVISNVTISSVTEKGYRITCNVSDDSGISSVSFPTWSHNNGQDDLVWHEGELNGNIATCYIPTSQHNSETGMFATHIYAYDIYGNLGAASTDESNNVNVSSEPIEVSTKIFNNKKYTVFNSGYNWEEAKNWCEENGGHLATVTSQKEWDNVKTLLADFNYTYCWLGAESTSGEWKWVTGEKFSYSDWYAGEPNCANNNEFFLGTFGTTFLEGKLWNDYDLNSDGVGGFVCEYEPLQGDINSDWEITLEDLILVQRYIISTDEPQDITEMALADMNSDGKITVVDVLMLQRILLSP